MVQRRHGTDKVEHHFAHIRGHVTGAHPTVVSAAQASNAAGMGASLTGGTSRRAAAGSNNAGATHSPQGAEVAIQRRVNEAAAETKKTLLSTNAERKRKLNKPLPAISPGDIR
jgi:DNA uptake protein ComE-like DNA-binding protein